MCYINLRFTYLLTYLLTAFTRPNLWSQWLGRWVVWVDVAEESPVIIIIIIIIIKQKLKAQINC